MSAIRLFTLILMIVLAVVGAGCQSGNPNANPEPVTIHVLTLDRDDTTKNWIEPFELEHPHITVKVIDPASDMQANVDSISWMIEQIASHQADVIFLSGDAMPSLVSQNQLMDLEPLIKKNDFDFENYAPVVQSNLKQLGDGKLFALAPFFNGYALVYNKDTFSALKLNDPTEKETWEDLFLLAAQMHSEDQYGLQFPSQSAFATFSMFAHMRGIQFYDESSKRMTVDTEKVKGLFNTVADLYRNHAAYESAFAEDQPKDIHFFSGNAAMAVMDYNSIVESGQLKDQMRIGYLPVPQFADGKGDEGLGLDFKGLAGISVASKNVDAAWTFVSFMNAEKLAKVKSDTYKYLPSRTAVKSAMIMQNVQLEPFYADRVPANAIVAKSNPALFTAFQTLGESLLLQVIQNNMTLEEAIKEFDATGNVYIEKFASQK